MTPKNKRSPIFNQHGFSLMEVMVAASLMGVLALGMMSLQKSGITSQKNLLAMDDSRSLTNAISNMLADPAACTYTFGGKAVNVTNAITNIYDKNNTVRYTTGSTAASAYGNKGLFLYGVTLGHTSPTTTTEPNTKQVWYTGTIPSAGNTDQAQALVLIDYMQRGAAGSYYGSQHIYRYFNINVTIDSTATILTTPASSRCTTVTAASIVSSQGTGTQNYVAKWTNNTGMLGNSLLYDSGTAVGLGTTSPASIFHVQQDQDANSFVSVVNSSTGANASAFYTANSDLAAGLLRAVSTTNAGLSPEAGRPGGVGLYTNIAATGGLSIAARNASGIITLHTGGTGAASERVRINASGNVGIGTTTPGSDVTFSNGGLTVNSTGTTQMTVQKSGVSGMAINTSGSSTGDFTLFDKGKTGTWNASITSFGSSVGIGNVAFPPYRQFEVAGTAQFGGNGAVNSYVFVGADPTTLAAVVEGRTRTNSAKKDLILNPWGGAVGIGYAYPAATAEATISGNQHGLLAYTSANTYYSVLGTNTASGCYGYLGTNSLSAGGNCTTSFASDARLKTDITPIGDGLKAIMALKPVSYRWKNDNKNHLLIGESRKKAHYLGFIAQEVEKVLPDLVTEQGGNGEGTEKVKGLKTPEKGWLSLDYLGLIAPLVAAVQEIKHGMDHLQDALDQLKKAMADLSIQVANLNTALTKAKGENTNALVKLQGELQREFYGALKPLKTEMNESLQKLEAKQTKELEASLEPFKKETKEALLQFKAELRLQSDTLSEEVAARKKGASRDLASVKPDFSELKARSEKLEQENKALKKQNEEIRKYLCAKDPSAAFCH